MDKSMMNYARLLLDRHIESPFPKYVEFISAYGTLVKGSLILEWKPSKYTVCSLWGHVNTKSRKKNHISREWGKITKDIPATKT